MEDPEAEVQIEFVAETAGEVPHIDQLEPEGLALLEDGMTPDGFVEALLHGEQWNDALGFWARAVPMARGIRWARACVVDALEEAGEEGPGGETQRVMQSVDAWIEEPSDERRRGAFDAAQDAGLDTAPAILALAIFLSEGSMSLPELEPVPAEDGLAHTALAGSVQLATVLFAPEKSTERVKRFLALGRQICAAPVLEPEQSAPVDENKTWHEMDLESGYDLTD